MPNEKRYNYENVFRAFIKHSKAIGIGIISADFLDHVTFKATKTTQARIS